MDCNGVYIECRNSAMAIKENSPTVPSYFPKSLTVPSYFPKSLTVPSYFPKSPTFSSYKVWWPGV